MLKIVILPNHIKIKTVPNGDIVISTDINTTFSDEEEFFKWFGDLNFEHKILNIRKNKNNINLCNSYGIEIIDKESIFKNGIEISCGIKQTGDIWISEKTLSEKYVKTMCEKFKTVLCIHNDISSKEIEIFGDIPTTYLCANKIKKPIILNWESLLVGKN